METTLLSYEGKLTREDLALVPTPAGTATHKPIPHGEVISALVETLGFRHISVIKDEYAVSKDGMKMFGVMELGMQFHGCRFAIGIRNSHDKTFRLAMTVGYRVFVCENLMFNGDYTPVLAKHSKNFSIQNALSIGADAMQRNYGPLVEQVQLWQESQLSEIDAKMLIYEAFITGALEVPRHLARPVHEEKTMRHTKLVFALFGLATLLVAADPFAGTWKADPAKAKYKTVAPPKEQTVTIAESGSDLDITIKGTAADGSAISSHYTVPAAGGQGKIIESPYEAVSGKRMGEKQREVRYSKGGKVALTVHSRVSSDGKALTTTVKGTDLQGKPVDGTNVYDKQ
jgi:hypothetical protein